MKPGRLDFTAWRGKPFHADFIYSGGGKLIDLTGWSGKLQVRRYPGAPVLAEISTVAGSIVLGGDTGTVVLQMTEAETAAVPIINARYDLELRDVLDTPIIPIAGRFDFKGVITE